MPLDYGPMSVPGASDLGGLLQGQVAGETEEERKKRMQALASSRLSGQTPGASSLSMNSGYGAALSNLGGAAGIGR